MRKQLAIGISVLALTALGGASENSVFTIKQGAYQQYTHLTNSNQSQILEPMSRASLIIGLPNRLNFKTAAVSFITGNKELDFGSMDFEDPTVDLCKNNGYSQVSCPAGQIAGSVCPYNPSYFDKCCDAKYKYNKDECTYPKTVSGDSCRGKYMCYCDKSLYSISSCPSPQIPEGDSCEEDGVTYYTKCVCPSSYSQACNEQNQEGVGEGCTQNGETKYTSCQCKSGYNMTCSDLGPVTPSDYCLKDGIKYYNNCKTCGDKCSLPECPEGNICEYEDCSQKYCEIGCAVDYINWCKKPETNCATLGYTKTSGDCSDEYLICPYDNNALFCEDWNVSCTSGSILGANQNCYDYPSIPRSVKPVGIVFDAVNRLAIALTNVKLDGSAGSEVMAWSSKVCNIPDLENCSKESLYTCDIDGKKNTDAILAANGGCSGTTYAANAVNAYQPSNCSADFYKKGKWFLPSLQEFELMSGFASISIEKSLTLLEAYGACHLKDKIRINNTRTSLLYYWTSSGFRSSSGNINIYETWVENFNSRGLYNSSKTSANYVRPVVKF